MILLWPTEELQNVLHFLICSDIPRCAGVKLSRSQVWVFLLDLVYTVQPPKSGDLLNQAVIPSDLCIASFSSKKAGQRWWCVLLSWIWDVAGMFMGVGSGEMVPSTSGSQDVAPRIANLPSHRPLQAPLLVLSNLLNMEITLFSISENYSMKQMQCKSWSKS